MEHEYHTISAPNSNGLVLIYIAVVLSTINNILFLLHIFDISFISYTFIVGLVGVSNNIALVFLLIQFSIFYKFVKSVVWNFKPLG